ADRCIAVDENGEVVDGDAILYICGKHMKEEGNLESNTIVTTIMSNIGLYKSLDKLGINYSKTQVGDKYVHIEMSENGYELGGEQSGHIIFSKYANTGDGILTSLRLMEAMIDNKASLSELKRDLKIYPQVLKNVRVKDKSAVLSDESIKNIIEKQSQDLKDSGRILVRESGTEPVIRVMAEAETKEIANEKVDNIVEAIEKSGL
ncbi:MAG: phosphoglucosamine mutase, partial [Anaerococcus sp.]|nr:phosphoglucosamine mutase [Anaerococcus sp.]